MIDTGPCRRYCKGCHLSRMSRVALASASVSVGVAAGLAIASAGVGLPLEAPLVLFVLTVTYALFSGSSKTKANQAAFWDRCLNVPSGNDKADFMNFFHALNAELLEDLESKEARPLPILPMSEPTSAMGFSLTMRG